MTPKPARRAGKPARREPRVWRWRLRNWAWRHAGEPLLWARLFAYAHGCHWRERWRWLRTDSRIEALEGVLAGIQIVVGLMLCFSPDRRTYESPVTLLMLQYASHGVWGGLILTAGLCNIVGLLEWDLETAPADARTVPDAVARRARQHLVMLLGLRQSGLLCGMSFWFLTWMLLLPHWYWWTIHVFVGFAAAELWLHKRVGGLFVTEQTQWERRRLGLEPAPTWGRGRT